MVLKYNIRVARALGSAIRGRTEVLRRFRAELEGRQRRERIVLGKAHSEAVREIERKEGETYRNGMEGSKERAWRAARTNGRSTVYNLPIDRYSRLSVWEERMELVRELDGEQAYEKMRRKRKEMHMKSQIRHLVADTSRTLKRKLCDHNKTMDPTAAQVDDLIAGVAKTIKTLF